MESIEGAGVTYKAVRHWGSWDEIRAECGTESRGRPENIDEAVQWPAQEVEAFATERKEYLVAARWVGALDTCNALGVIAAGSRRLLHKRLPPLV
jgi:hypothetical protein